MARITRIALDLTLVSLRTVGPAVSKLWATAKDAITNTPAKFLVRNPLVDKAETALGNMSETMTSYITTLRDRQLPKEQEYLEKELEKVKKASKTLKPALGTVWQYAKSEMVPPMTVNFFYGPIGKKLEASISEVADICINKIQKQIRSIELQEAREIQRKEAEAKAAEARVKAEIKRKAEEIKRKETEKLAKETKARRQIEAEKKAVADKKATATAPKAPESKATKPKANTKNKSKKKPAKKNTCANKRASSRKTKK